MIPRLLIYASCLIFIFALIPTSVSVDEPSTPLSDSDTTLTQQQHLILYYPGELVVKFKDGVNPRTTKDRVITDVQSINSLNQKHSVKSMDRMFKGFEKKDKAGKIEVTPASIKAQQIKAKFPIRAKRVPTNTKVPSLENIFILKLPDNADIQAIAGEYSANPFVEYAQPNFIPVPDFIPNDYYYSTETSLWGMYRIGTSFAWDHTFGNENIVIALADSGIDYNHPDLKDNMWINPGEDLNNNGVADDYNGIDDDNNGYIDDIRGWAGTNDNVAISSHGTHVAGTAGAVGNNVIGVIGVCWKCKLMNTYNNAQYIIYAADAGADIISNSWRKLAMDLAVRDAVDYAYSLGVVIISSSGNQKSDTYTQFPSAAEHSLSVANFKEGDLVSSSSSYGSKVDVAAPGTLIASTLPSSNYGLMSGTSMSTPHVSGLAGLILSINPDLTVEQIRQIIRKTASDLQYPFGTTEQAYPGWDIYSGYGMIDAEAAVLQASSDRQCEANILAPTVNYQIFTGESHNPNDPSRIFYDAKVILDTTTQVKATADATYFNRYILEYGAGEYPTRWVTLTESTTPIHDALIYAWDTINLNGLYALRLRVIDNNGIECDDRVHVTTNYALITFPGENNLILPSNIFLTKIKGFARHPDFKEWSLWIGSGDNPSEYILLHRDTTEKRGSGDYNLQIFEDNLIEGIDNANVPDGTATIKLVVETNSGMMFEDKKRYRYDGTHFPQQNGWSLYADAPNPRPTCIRSTICNIMISESISLYDLDNDGDKEIIYAFLPAGNTIVGKLFVRNADGSLYNGWPKSIARTTSGSPIIGDVNGDGSPEIGILSYYVTSTNILETYINVFDINGNPISSAWPKGPFESTSGYGAGTLTFFDIDSDGSPEIILSIPGHVSFGNKLFVYRYDGTLVWSAGLTYRIINRPAVGDLDNDGYAEIVVETLDNKLIIYNHDGTIQNTWNFVNINSDRSPPILADFDDDNDLEIVNIAKTSSSIILNIWHHDGSNLIGWPRDLNFRSDGQVSTTATGIPLIGDLDGDLKPEILIPQRSSSVSGGNTFMTLYAFNSDGSPVGNGHKEHLYSITGYLSQSGILTDVTGDNKANLLIGPDSNLYDFPLYAFDENRDFVNDDRFPLRVGLKYASIPAADDIDNDGDLEIVYLDYSSENILVWDLDVPYDKNKIEWPMLDHDPLHSGNYNYKIFSFISNIKNNAQTELKGYLTLKVQKNINGFWQDLQIIQDKLFITIPPNNFINIDNNWNSHHLTLPAGNYRAISEFKDANGNILQTSTGLMSFTSDFTVITTSTSTTIPIPSSQTFRQGVNGYTGVADTYVDSSNPDSNWQARWDLGLSNGAISKKYAIITFDISSISDTASIQNAYLMLSSNTIVPAGTIVSLHQLTTPGVIIGLPGATWNKKDGTNPWSSGAFSITDYANTPFASYTPIPASAEQYYLTSQSLTSYVESQLLSNKIEFVVVNDDTVDSTYAISASEVNPIDMRPKLFVEYIDLGTTTTSTTTTSTSTTTTSTTSTTTILGLSTLYPSDDAHASNYSTQLDQNYGRNNFLYSYWGSHYKLRFFLKFNLDSCISPKKITSAELYLKTYVYSSDACLASPSAPECIRLYSVPDNSWSEGSLTGRNQPALGGFLDSIGSVQPRTWYSFDVSSVVIGNGVYSFGTDTDSGDATRWSSKENGTDSSPKLVVNCL